MIRSRLYLVCLKHGSQFLHLLPRYAIHDTALPGVVFYEFYYLSVYVLGLLPYLVIEVGTVERAPELTRVRYAEAFLYVCPHLVGGGGGKRDDRSRAYLGYCGSYVAVFGTEVVSPLRYAVSLVYGVERNLHRPEKLYVVLFVQRLRSHVEQLGPAAVHVVHHLLQRRLVERRVKIVRHSALLTESVDHVHLVFHQRDERRHDNCRALHDERRELIAQALSATRGHEHERVVAVEQVTYDGFLVSLELVEAEIAFQFLIKISFICHRVYLE